MQPLSPKCIECGKHRVNYPFRDALVKPMFCSLKCALKWAIKQLRNYRWCHTCHKWTENDIMRIAKDAREKCSVCKKGRKDDK